MNTFSQITILKSSYMMVAIITQNYRRSIVIVWNLSLVCSLNVDVNFYDSKVLFRLKRGIPA